MRLIQAARRTIVLVLLGAAHCFGPGTPAARAAVYSWANAGTTWGDASNWGGNAPGSGDIGMFGLGAYTYQPNLLVAAAVGGIWETGGGGLTIGGVSTLTLQAALINGNYATGIEMDPGTGADDQHPRGA